MILVMTVLKWFQPRLSLPMLMELLRCVTVPEERGSAKFTSKDQTLAEFSGLAA